MPVIETYYFIDFENVGSDGLEGCSNLTDKDQIHIFYTENSRRIDLDVFNDHGDARIIVHKVKVEKESIDMHIVAYLGYLLGINKGTDFRYVIISRDKDYDKIISFWEKETGVTVERAPRIKPGEQKKNRKNHEKASGPVRNSGGKRKPGPERSDSSSVRRGPKAKASESAGAASGHKSQPEAKKLKSPGSFAAKKPSKTSADVSAEKALHSSKPLSNEKLLNGEKASRSVPDIRIRMNQDIQKALSKAGMKAEISNYVASVAVKNAGEFNGKQITYQTIINKYGMIKGLNIYRHVKKHIP